ncbi:Rieske 2Fe-2S domain-containing protein [Micromonospora peucetia]|uniref:Rieske 2Fe-2S domain-containing protein n=1 Tax=Micromonospora peucetia TaxID=47871 RepID=A0A1C6U551_9ACTN|nr:Rieske 2Fe-2S domain-containing protein [Micromonospora peucetia]MCX4386096.1 Rieske 2Fe-2S domain-containing protein [Micromonospora peucetia]WSA33457.1 Rieske 2Fe-2S domain-containing protein [Micromonospora peucetia]SCL49205.1 UDP-MurNAc hydroxylase [Micromonospora peucetia]
MRVTGTGHASMRIDTAAGSILCDPWVNPAYFASWFPFPDNSLLDWEALGDTDYLYVSHLHRDHFDGAHLKRFVSKSATVLLPAFPTSEMEDELRELGFTKFLKAPNEQVVELDGGLKVMIQALTSPTDGPIGDSSLWVEYDGVRLLNQNDARPTDLSIFTELGHVHAHMLQFSGAIWYPMVYELPQAAKTAFGKQKRDRQFDRTWRYIDDLKADHVFPIAGPPCFLDDELWQFNDIHGDEGNIFPDQSVFLSEYAKVGGTNGIVLLPGSVTEVTSSGAETTHPVPVEEFFANKVAHLEEMRERKRPVIEAEKASWRHPDVDVLKEMQRRIEPLLEESIYLAKGVGGPVRFDLVGYDGDSVESIVVDFPGKQVRPYADEKVRYRFRTDRAMIEHLLHIGEVDWVNSLFLSCRFSAARIGQYNEFVYAFFKCLSTERLQYAEGWYDEHERSTDAEDITLGDWVLQRRCPHLKADLTRFGIVEGDQLTCQLHGWRFDLASGRCLTSVGHKVRAHRVGEQQTSAPVDEAAS